MTPQQEQELKGLLCKWCRLGHKVTIENGVSIHITAGDAPCTANPAVIAKVDEMMNIPRPIDVPFVDHWTKILMSRHSNQLSMDEVRNLALDIAEAIAAAEEATVEAALAYCLARSKKLGEYRKSYSADMPSDAIDIDRLKFAQTQLDLLSDELSALAHTNILANREAAAVQQATDNVRKECGKVMDTYGIVIHELQAEIRELKGREAEIRRQERAKWKERAKWMLEGQITLASDLATAFASERSISDYLARMVGDLQYRLAELTAPPTTGTAASDQL